MHALDRASSFLITPFVTLLPHMPIRVAVHRKEPDHVVSVQQHLRTPDRYHRRHWARHRALRCPDSRALRHDRWRELPVPPCVSVPCNYPLSSTRLPSPCAFYPRISQSVHLGQIVRYYIPRLSHTPRANKTDRVLSFRYSNSVMVSLNSRRSSPRGGTSTGDADSYPLSIHVSHQVFRQGDEERSASNAAPSWTAVRLSSQISCLDT